MSERTRKHPTDDFIRMKHNGCVYHFPKRIAEIYKTSDKNVASDDLFSDIKKKNGKPGNLLKGLRLRDSLTQTEIAKILKVTQSDISQMETGTRKIGRTLAKRIAKLFDIDYRVFLD